MTQQTWEWAEAVPSAGSAPMSAPFEDRVQNALILGISRMVEKGRIPLSRVGEALQRFGLNLSRRELLDLCRRRGWRVRLERDPYGLLSEAVYTVGVES